MKRFLGKTAAYLLMAVLVITTMITAGCGSSEQGNLPSDTPDGNAYPSEKVLNIFTWDGYVPKSVIASFEDQTGIAVNYSNFTTNEEMLAKLEITNGGDIDIVICSDYIIEKMAKSSNPLIAEIDKSKLANYENIEPQYLGQFFDPENKYTVPYAGGNVMILYDPSKVPFEITGYKDLWRDEFRDSLVMVDDQRNIMGMTLKSLGFSMNETDPAKLNQAKNELMKLKQNIKVYDTDTPHTQILSGEASAGFMFSSQVFAAVNQNPELKFVYAKEGVGIGIDCIVIPKNAPHTEAAYMFIDYVLNGSVSADITAEIQYSNFNKEAKPYLEKKLGNIDALGVPADKMANSEIMRDIGDAADLYDEIWTEFKQ